MESTLIWVIFKEIKKEIKNLKKSTEIGWCQSQLSTFEIHFRGEGVRKLAFWPLVYVLRNRLHLRPTHNSIISAFKFRPMTNKKKKRADKTTRSVPTCSMYNVHLSIKILDCVLKITNHIIRVCLYLVLILLVQNSQEFTLQTMEDQPKPSARRLHTHYGRSIHFVATKIINALDFIFN